MKPTIELKTNVSLGVVPTHLRFVGGLVPDADGRLPRESNGAIRVVDGMRELLELSPVAIRCVQVSLFPGTDPADLDESVGGLRALGLEVDFVLMVGGVNPMDPADEDAVVAQLLPNLRAAVKHQARHVSSTSIEEWMSARESRREGAAFDAAIAQNVNVHLRAYQEAGLEHSTLQHWHIEFLRPGEFKTFTSLERGWRFVHAMNQALGKSFFRILVDAAHCADSGVSMAENEAWIEQIGRAGELGVFHASAKTTRGCLSTDDGWCGALLAAMAKTGGLTHVYVETFDHEDPALELLRRLDPGHGVDTRDGRSHSQVVADGLVDVARRLNQLKVRGLLKS